jgi:hypothetical protein
MLGTVCIDGLSGAASCYASGDERNNTVVGFAKGFCFVTGIIWCAVALTMPEYNGFTVCGLGLGLSSMAAIL